MTGDWMDNDDDVLVEAATPAGPSPDLFQPAPRPATPDRPEGARSDRKQVALRVPKQVIDWYKAAGPGWRSRMIDVLEREAARG